MDWMIKLFMFLFVLNYILIFLTKGLVLNFVALFACIIGTELRCYWLGFKDVKKRIYGE